MIFERSTPRKGHRDSRNWTKVSRVLSVKADFTVSLWFKTSNQVFFFLFRPVSLEVGN